MSLQLDFPAVLERWPMFLDGAVLTLRAGGLRDGARRRDRHARAIGRGHEAALIAGACTVYVETIRNTPLLVQIFLVYFGLASLGLKFSAFTVAVAALTINVGAYTTEIMRAGFESIHTRPDRGGRSAWRCRACRSTGTSSCCRRSSRSIRR